MNSIFLNHRNSFVIFPIKLHGFTVKKKKDEVFKKRQTWEAVCLLTPWSQILGDEAPSFIAGAMVGAAILDYVEPIEASA